MADQAPATPPGMRCWACYKLIDEGDAFCRHCGKAQGRYQSWVFRPGWVLVLALTVLWPLALPLVWYSRRMSAAMKGVMTSIIVAYTVAVVWLAAYLFLLLWRHFSEIAAIDTLM